MEVLSFLRCKYSTTSLQCHLKYFGFGYTENLVMFTKTTSFTRYLCSCQNIPREGPPWAGCQRCHPGLLKWLPERREQLHPITNSKQMVICGDMYYIITSWICDSTLCFPALKLRYLCVAPADPPSLPCCPLFGYCFCSLL